MIHYKKGFIVPLLILIIAILAGVIVYSHISKESFITSITSDRIIETPMQDVPATTKDESPVESPKENSQATNRIAGPIKGNLKPSIYGDEYIIYVYNTDGKKVYFKEMEILGADLATFTPIENGRYMHSYAKDKNYVYYGGTRIEGADPASFEILWMLPPEGCSNSQYSRDKNNIYFKASLVVGADLKTFVPLTQGPVQGSADTTSGQYGKDKMHVFKENRMLPNVKPQDFTTVCNYG